VTTTLGTRLTTLTKLEEELALALGAPALRVNGSVTAIDPSAALAAASSAQDASVTAVTASRKRRPTRAIRLSPDRFARLQTLRQEAGLTWNELADWVVELCGV